MRILLLGANGQVGHCLRTALAPLGGVVAATRTGTLAGGGTCEVADFDQPHDVHDLVMRVAPDVVVNAAAYTAVDRAETERDAAFRANAEAPGAIAQACVARDAHLVHYSTDYVFDGQGTRPYREDDPTAPLGVYGASKLAGEEAIRASGARHHILRTAWVYAAQGRNFMHTMLRLAAERDVIRVVADQVGTPTSADLIARVTAQLLDGRLPATGTWHLTASGQTSWHGFAEAIVAGAHARGLLARRTPVEAISTAEFPTPARRPAWSVLDCTRLQVEAGVSLPEWRAGLDAVLDQLR